ncbi:MAG: hypothetical protein NTX16_03120 [Actinobacteria bacterium]|nr:hypothetical protein [Actinomycetota bacterium]
MTEERQAEPGRRLKVVYCGGCNPHIDRTAVAAELAAGLPAAESPAAELPAESPAAELPAAGPDIGPAATVHLSGCPRACASDHLLVSDDPSTVVVAGELVDGVPTPAPELAPTITRKLKE